jgi:hypothetical protein
MKTNFSEQSNQEIVLGSVILTDSDKYLVITDDKNGYFRLLDLDDLNVYDYSFNDEDKIKAHIEDYWGEGIIKVIAPDKLTIVEENQRAPIF